MTCEACVFGICYQFRRFISEEVSNQPATLNLQPLAGWPAEKLTEQVANICDLMLHDR